MIAGDQLGLREKAIAGSFALLARQAICLPMNAIGVICLSHFLTPTDFGVQSLTTVCISASFMIIDAGLSQALVQSKEPASLAINRRVLLYKRLTALVLSTLAMIVAADVLRWYGLAGRISATYFVACVIGALLQSERSQAAVWLQRRVEWGSLARIEIAEVATQNIVALTVAYVFRSAWVFPASIIGRYLVGVILLHKHAAPSGSSHRIGNIALSRLVGFGLSTQATSGLSLIQNAINPLVVGSVAGIASSGLVSWSLSIAALPTLPFQTIQMLLFSVAAEARRRGTYDGTLLACCLRAALAVGTLVAVGLVPLMPSIIKAVFGREWLPATAITSILMFANVCVWFNGLVTSQLLAFGLSTSRMAFAVLEFLCLWALAGTGAWVGDGVGYALGFTITQILLALTLLEFGRRRVAPQLNTTFVASVLVFAAVLTTAVAMIDSHRAVGSIFFNAGISVASVLLTAVYLFTFHRRLLRDDVRRLWALHALAAASATVPWPFARPTGDCTINTT
jgi:O-antigen/teichoic acid export membrane protein